MFNGSIFLDANLLLLLAIGVMDRAAIPAFKRTACFTIEDFDRLAELAGRATSLVTTPHVLTEVSNLANALREDQRDAFVTSFRLLIGKLDERFTMASVLAEHELFRFGLADVSALQELNGVLFLTEDGRFASQLGHLGGLALDLKTALLLQKQLS